MKTASYVTYNDIFPEIIQDKEIAIIDFLEMLNKEEVIVRVIEILNLISNPKSSINEQYKIFNNHCIDDRQLEIVSIVRGKGRGAIFFRGQIFELLNTLLKIKNDNSEENKSLSLACNREILLKALLLASEQRTNQTYKSLRNKNIDYFQKALAIRKGREDSNKATEYYYNLAKAHIIFNKIFPKIIHNFLQIFTDSIGLNTEEYIECYSFFLLLLNNDDQYLTGVFHLNLLKDVQNKDNKLQYFLDKFSMKIKNIKSNQEYEKQIIYNPIIKTDGKYIIGDYITFLKLITDFPIFNLEGENRRNYWLIQYGEAIEQYVFSLLERIYTHSSINIQYLNNIEYFINGERYQIDSLIYNTDSISIIEIKQAFLNNNSQNIDNPDNYLSGIDQKYGISADGKSIKGIAQLARTIYYYVNGEIKKLDDFKTIIPILIVNDNLIATPLSNLYLSNKFRDLFLGAEDSENNTFMFKEYKIFPLIVISVEEMEILEETITRDGFENILKKYIKDRDSENTRFLEFVGKHYNILDNKYLSGIVYDKLLKMKDDLFPDFIEN